MGHVEASRVASRELRMNIAIVGNGRMGKAVAALGSQQGHSIHTVVDSGDNPGGRALTRERLRGADVAVEFTGPEAVVPNLERLIELPSALNARSEPAFPSGQPTAFPGLYFMGYTHSLRGHLFEANRDSRRLAQAIGAYLSRSVSIRE